MKAEGRTFLGVRRVKAQRFTNRPKTRAPRRRRNPTVAAVEAKVAEKAIRDLDVDADAPDPTLR